jgi:hypothetical protein
MRSEQIGPRTVGMCKGLDLVARVIVGEGFFGSIKGAGLPEIGPLHSDAKIIEALTKIVGVYEKYSNDPKKTVESPEYMEIMQSYNL